MFKCSCVAARVVNVSEDEGLTYVEAADVENNHPDLGVDGLVLLVDERAVVHLERKEAELKEQPANFI